MQLKIRMQVRIFSCLKKVNCEALKINVNKVELIKNNVEVGAVMSQGRLFRCNRGENKTPNKVNINFPQQPSLPRKRFQIN